MTNLLDRLGLQCTGVGPPLCRCLRCRADQVLAMVGKRIEDLARDTSIDLADVLVIAMGDDQGPVLRTRRWSDLERELPDHFQRLRLEAGQLEPGHVAFFITLDGSTFAGNMATSVSRKPLGEG